MRISLYRQVRRSLSLAVVGTLAVALTACTGRGGGQLAASTGFTGPASFGFSFSCEDKGGLNPSTGQLRIQLSYTDHGSNPLGSSFSIHGTVDEIDPVDESMFCIGQNPSPGGNELIFLGRYRVESGAPSNLPLGCRETGAALCRFEVTVRDNDKNRAPSPGDYFQIALSSDTAPSTVLTSAPFYIRAGYLSSGNLTVD